MPSPDAGTAFQNLAQTHAQVFPGVEVAAFDDRVSFMSKGSDVMMCTKRASIFSIPFCGLSRSDCNRPVHS